MIENNPGDFYLTCNEYEKMYQIRNILVGIRHQCSTRRFLNHVTCKLIIMKDVQSHCPYNKSDKN